MPKKLTIEECKTFAIQKGGLCLTEIYTNSKTKMLWQCEHQWYAKFNNIKNNNTWCPFCNNNDTKLTIEECKQIALQKGGLCLTEIYTDSRTKMLWQCENKHQWYAIFHSVKNLNTW